MYYTIQRNRDEAWLSLGRALRSGRRGRVFRITSPDSFRPDGQAVKTTPSHGVNPSDSRSGHIGKAAAFVAAFFLKMNMPL